MAAEIKNFCDISKEEQIDFISSFDTVLSDCDGVIWQIVGNVEGADKSIKSLREAGKKIYFVSNNSVRDFSGYQQKFKDANIPLEEDELIHPVLSIKKYLKSINFSKKAFVVASEAFRNSLKEDGFDVCTAPNVSVDGNIQKAVSSLNLDPDIGAVLLDFDINTNVTSLNNCLPLLKRRDVKFIVGATDKKIPITPTFNIIGPGYFIDILKQMTGKEPMVFGKPGTHLRDIINAHCDVTDPQKVLFIGDMLDPDMAFGAVCGFRKILVLTGGTSIDDLHKCDNPNYYPDYYVNSLSDLHTILQSIKLGN